ISGAMGCALGQMAAGISLRSKKLDEAHRPSLVRTSARLGELRGELQNCAAEDSLAFEGYMKALKIPKEDPSRKAELQKALMHGMEVPLRTARTAAAALKELGRCPGIAPHVMSDYKSAVYLLEAAVKCAAENVYINAGSLEDKTAARKMVEEARGCVSPAVPA
ncbi:MAG TPA: cyclodeaminase/cyclohydrolase family protein, partial [Elusimicrobiales bacterium]|nr:cyclodeaminase/cyclohydrolase family protein [Elusimicrobiales bacterium]